jgi:hypothetical protein
MAEMTIKVVEESCESRGAKVSVSAISLENAALILVTDKRNEYRLGTVALAMPMTGRMGQTTPSILTLFGSGEGLLAKALAGKTSTKIGKAALAIVGLREDDFESISPILKAAEKIIDRICV